MTFLAVMKENLQPNSFNALKKLRGGNPKNTSNENVPIGGKGRVAEPKVDPVVDWSSYMEKIKQANNGQYFDPRQ